MPVDELLERACPSIRSRIHREILGASRCEAAVAALQEEIREDAAVKAVLATQHPDGWIGWNFHGYDSIESAIRLLCEKDLDPANAFFSRALATLQTMPERLQRGIGRVGPLLDGSGLGGSLTIRAALLAQAGQETSPHVRDEIPRALSAFRAVLEGESVQDFIAPYRGKPVFRDGMVWPSIYHVRLLAFTQGWRTPENRRAVAEAVGRMVDWAPLPQVYLRHRSRLVAPACFGLRDMNPDMLQLDGARWMIWFHRMEMLARLGVVHRVPQLRAQVARLRQMLAPADGRFTKPLSHTYFRKWGAYTGLMLEKDWRKAERREYDLTFRSLLILHFAGGQPR
jgi:hypothetical protein